MFRVLPPKIIPKNKQLQKKFYNSEQPFNTRQQRISITLRRANTKARGTET